MYYDYVNQKLIKQKTQPLFKITQPKQLKSIILSKTHQISKKFLKDKVPASMPSLLGIFQIIDKESYNCAITMALLDPSQNQQVKKIIPASKSILKSISEFTNNATQLNFEVSCQLKYINQKIVAGQQLLLPKSKQISSLQLVIKGSVIGYPELQIESSEVPLQNVTQLLKQVFCKDILPHSMPVSHCHRFQDFCQYMVYPYLVIQDQNFNEKLNNQGYNKKRNLEFMMFVRSMSLLQDPILSSFLDSNVAILLNHIQGKKFRIAVAQAEIEQLTINIDLQFDDNETFKYFVNKVEFTDEQKQNNPVHQKVLHLKRNIHKEIYLQSVKLRDDHLMELQKIIQKIVSLVERVLLQNSKNQVIQDIKQKKAKAVDAFRKLDDFALFRASLSRDGNKCFIWAVQQLNGEYKDLTHMNERSLYIPDSRQQCKLQIQYGWDIHVYSIYPLTLRQSYKKQIYRNHFYSYERFLQNFGIPIDQIKNRAQLLMFLQTILDSLQIEYPDDDDIKSNHNGANDQSLYQINSRFFESFGYK